MIENNKLLSQVNFSILFALSLKPRHGYELMQQVEEDSIGLMSMGPGTLYGAIKLLSRANYIEELPSFEDERRKNYRLTKKGWDRLELEMKYYAGIVRRSKDRNLLNSR